jgi:glutamyl-tRNA(Gln) amidotransferase subunit E
LIHTEQFKQVIKQANSKVITEILNAGENDAQIIIWGPEEDMKTAIETVEERCKMAFDGVPNETRKSFEDGTTIFERVLPGADRMYPDTDSVPIPLEDSDIERLKENLPDNIIDRYQQLKKWDIPEDTYNYILSKNLYPLIKRIINELNVKPRFVGTFFGHNFKFIEGQYIRSVDFKYSMLHALFKFLVQRNLD